MSTTQINEKHRAAINELKAVLGATNDDFKEELRATDINLRDWMSYATGHTAVTYINGRKKGGSATRPFQVIMRGLTMNNGVGVIKYQESKNWSGHVFGAYPPRIAAQRMGSTTHRAVSPKDSHGSMAAVVYVGPNVQGQPNSCAWVLAWSTPGNGSTNKIYVEAGPSTKYPAGAVNWDVIKANLQRSSNQSYYRDDDTGAEASAEITRYGNSAEVAAVFDVTPNDYLY